MIGLIIFLILLIIIYMYGYIIINILKQKYISGSLQRKPRLKSPKEHPNICRAAVNTSRLGVSDLEDRENDWLARQLKEEARLKKRMLSDMNRQ